jgi:hypothetical protein
MLQQLLKARIGYGVVSVIEGFEKMRGRNEAGIPQLRSQVDHLNAGLDINGSVVNVT